ncbi:MAG: 4-hydroxy-tetrahydrodipicolinate synthase [Bacteroidota bacterium]|nr:4-hydroxy-tetrahydrodipicolinate synthase [Bacteroidota bacterium]
MSFNYTGTGVALVTPFTANGEVDYDALGKLIDHVINGGVEYLVVLGTTGESATLTKEEKKNIYKFAVQANNKRVNMVAGMGGNNTAELLETAAHFDYEGYDAVLSVSPYYNKPNQNGIYEHYKAFANKSPLPVIIYNVPGRTGSNISAETQLRLANDISNIVCTKEASGNFEQCMDVIQGKPANFKVVSGDDAITLSLIGAGMDGVISVIGNAYPRIFSDMVRAALANDYETARRLHYKVYELSKLIFTEGSPGGVKYILKQIGVCGDTVRLPLYKISPALEQKMHNIMQTI